MIQGLRSSGSTLETPLLTLQLNPSYLLAYPLRYAIRIIFIVSNPVHFLTTSTTEPNAQKEMPDSTVFGISYDPYAT